MYDIEITCEFHGKFFVPADDASCPICDKLDEEIFSYIDESNGAQKMSNEPSETDNKYNDLLKELLDVKILKSWYIARMSGNQISLEDFSKTFEENAGSVIKEVKDEISIKALRYDAIVNELYRRGMDTGIGFYGVIEFIKNAFTERSKALSEVAHIKELTRDYVLIADFSTEAFVSEVLGLSHEQYAQMVNSAEPSNF